MPRKKGRLLFSVYALRRRGKHHDKEGHVCCDLTLKMQREISLEDINDFIQHNRGIVSAESSPVT